MDEINHLENAIKALEAQRGELGDTVVNMAVAPLRARLARLRLERKESGEFLVGADQQALEQRRLLTVLFADLAGFTAMSEQLDPEDVRELMQAYFSRWSACIERYHGEVEKFIGDAVMAVFGIQIGQEDDPENAIRAALEMAENLQELNRDLSNQPRFFTNSGVPLKLAMRIGIHTGVVVASMLGEQKTSWSTPGQEFSIVGDTVNLASRLQTVAPPNGIIISQETYRHVRGIFNVKMLEPVSLKGKSLPVQIYQVLNAKPRSFRKLSRGVEGIETRMVGRESELSHLQKTFQLILKEGGVKQITVTGEAGVGKSRLISEFDEWLDILPQIVYYYKGRSTPSMQAVPYSLLRDLFSFRFLIHDSDPLHVVSEKMEMGIAVCLETEAAGEAEADRSQAAQIKAHFIGQLIGFDFSASPHLQGVQSDGRQFRDRALGYLGEYFIGQASRYPILLFLEDIHWADERSLEAVLQLVKTLERRLEGQGVMVIAAARPSLLERQTDWLPPQAELVVNGSGEPYSPAHTRLQLQPLSHEKSRVLVEDILQKVADLPAALGDLIVNHADGNPFYIEELIKMFIEDGVILKDEQQWRVQLDRLAQLHVPPTLTEVLQARLDSLAIGERLTLQMAAVFGRVFWDQAIAYLAAGAEESLPFDPAENGVASASLSFESLTHREMISQRDQSTFENTHEYWFKHALLRDVAYESLLKRLRRIYHAHAAGWLALVTEHSQRADEYAALIAGHFDLARKNEPAAIWYVRAGKQAASQFANIEGLRCFSRALELLPPDDLARRAEVIKAREWLYMLQSDTVARKQDLDNLEIIARATSDDHLRAYVLERRANLETNSGNYPNAISLSQQAIDLAHAIGEVEIEINSYLNIGSIHWSQAAYDAAEAPLERALALSQAAALHNLEADALRNLGVVYLGRGEHAQARRVLELALELIHQEGDLRREGMVTNSLGVSYYEVGDYERGHFYLDLSLQAKRMIGDRRAEAITLHNLGTLSFVRGQHIQAQRYLEQSMELGVQIESPLEIYYPKLILGEVSLYQGDYEQAQNFLLSARDYMMQLNDAEAEAEALGFLGLLHYYLGDLSKARELLDLSLVKALEANSEVREANAQLFLGHVFLTQSQPAQAAQAYKRSLEIHRARGYPNSFLDPLVGLALASIEGSDQAAAVEAVAQVMDHLEKQEFRDALAGSSEPAWICLNLVRLLQGQGDARSTRLLAQAADWIQEQVNQFPDASRRTLFLNNPPFRRELLAMAALD